MKIKINSIIKFKPSSDNDFILIGKVTKISNTSYQLSTYDGKRYLTPKHRQCHNYRVQSWDEFKEIYPEELI